MPALAALAAEVSRRTALRADKGGLEAYGGNHD